jgi:D-sedoheptulose 7-phosphate isomerase
VLDNCMKDTNKKFIDKYIFDLKRSLDQLDRNKIGKIIDVLLQGYKNGKKVFIIGNGGSASNASHLACDLGKGTLNRIYDEKEKRFKVYSLTDNVALISAYANDLTYDDIFIEQLKNLVEEGDIVIALSGSGNSKNVIKAIAYAKRCKAMTIGFLGFETGGKLAKMVDLSIIVKSKLYGHCEDIQLVLDHIITMSLAKIKNT